jgi:hypothetical protein
MFRASATLTMLGFLVLAAEVSGCGKLDDLFDGHGNPAKPTACASTAQCPSGAVCTVESGVCNPPPGCSRDGGVCPAVCYGTCERKPADRPQCQTDAECRTFSFMCTGCDCLAVGSADPDPVCAGQGVQCFADPCLNKGAVCDAGQCKLKNVSCSVGSVAKRVCLTCGIAGGCSKVADCARQCKQNSDCAAEQTRCTDGLCQVLGCI